MKILVGYYSRTGNTKKMAESIVKGIKKEIDTVALKEVKDIEPDELLNYDVLIFGSPTYYGTMAGELKKLFDDSVRHHGKLEGKLGGAFTSSGMMAGGGETTIFSILEAMMIHGMIIKGDAHLSHYGPVAIGKPNPDAAEHCIKYGQKIARLAKRLFK